MSYLVAMYHGAAAKERARCLAPGAVPIADDIIEHIDRLTIHGSSPGDSDGVWSEFRAFDEAGAEIAYQRIKGY